MLGSRSANIRSKEFALVVVFWQKKSMSKMKFLGRGSHPSLHDL